MAKYLKYFSPLVFLLSLFCILSFKAIPNGKLWTNYSVLYVPVETDDEFVISTLRNCNIIDYVSLSEQYLPLNISENSVELAMFKLNLTNDGTEYHQRRGNYFFDKSNCYRLYYVPSSYKSQLADVVLLLNKQKINCGVDSTSTYPFVIPLIGLILLITLSLFSKNKYVFIAGAAPALIFLYCNPFYPVAISLCLILLIIFFISNTWKRDGFLLRLANTYTVPAMLFISLLCSFSSSYKSGLLFFVLIICIAAVLFTIYSIEEFIRNRKSFVPVFIKPARMINAFARKTNTTFIILLSGAFLFIGIFFLTSSDQINSHFAKLQLPANSDFSDEELPQLEDYYRWAWDLKTNPYRSLNKAENENLVEYPKYIEDENGLIRETKTVMAYNQSFKEGIFEDIDNLPFNSIEKVIKSEGIRFNGGYKSTSDYHNNLFGIIMMFISVFMLLFLYISIIIRKGAKK